MKGKRQKIHHIAGKEYACFINLCEIIGLSDSAIRSRLVGIPSKTIELDGNVRIEVYPVERVRKACSDLLEDLPQTDESGIVKIGNKEYASLTVCARLLGVSYGTLKKRIGTVKSRRVKNVNGVIIQAFPIETVTRKNQQYSKKKKS